MMFEVRKLPAGTFGCAIENPTKEQQDFFRSIVARNWMEAEVNHLRKKAGAFLQCECKEYILLEFWLEDYEPLIEWMNAHFEEFIQNRLRLT